MLRKRPTSFLHLLEVDAGVVLRVDPDAVVDVTVIVRDVTAVEVREGPLRDVSGEGCEDLEKSGRNLLLFDGMIFIDFEPSAFASNIKLSGLGFKSSC